MSYIIPWLICIMIFIFLKYNNKKLIYFLLLGSFIGLVVGLILKYIINVKADIGLYILIGYFTFGLIEILLKKVLEV